MAGLVPAITVSDDGNTVGWRPAPQIVYAIRVHLIVLPGMAADVHVMLVRLSIRDIVLIDRLDVDLASGLAVLTGETGAGKSILLDAFALALGARGDAALVRHGCEQGQVTAVFDIARDHPAAALLAASDIEAGDELILRRVQLADGRTRAFVNDQLDATVLTALAFGWLHGNNPSVTPLGLVNIGLAGVFLAAAFWAPGGIWTATGAHLGWNALIVSLDAPVSGIPFAMPFLDYDPGAPAWLTGGSFGPEGGALATLTIVGATALAIRWTRKERTT